MPSVPNPSSRPTAASGKRQVALTAVQETLLMPLWARAVQSRYRWGLIHDAKAIEIVDQIDYDFRKFNGSMQTMVGCVLRTIQFDNWVRDFLTRHRDGTVIDVGAGLNSRKERTDNGTATYVELDLPEAMAVRQQFFTEEPRRIQIAGSVLEEAWIDRVRQTGGPYQFIIEGVLMYLNEGQVQQLFATLAREFPGCHVGFDSMTPNGVKTQDRIRAMRNFDARFDWGIEVPRQIEAWDDRYFCLDSVNLRQVAVRNRHLIPRLLQFVVSLIASYRRAAVKDYWMTLMRLGTTS